MKIIGYAYDAAFHCIACTQLRHPYDNSGYGDINLIPFSAKDSEGNSVHPAFDTDETLYTLPACDTCLNPLEYCFTPSSIP